MSTQEVAIVAIAEPASGKADRVSQFVPFTPQNIYIFKELTTETINWMKANEPGTLEWSLYEENGKDGHRFIMYERYASQEAMDKHEASDSYKKFFQTATEEKLLAGQPNIVKGSFVAGLRR